VIPKAYPPTTVLRGVGLLEAVSMRRNRSKESHKLKIIRSEIVKRLCRGEGSEGCLASGAKSRGQLKHDFEGEKHWVEHFLTSLRFRKRKVSSNVNRCPGERRWVRATQKFSQARGLSAFAGERDLKTTTSVEEKKHQPAHKL